METQILTGRFNIGPMSNDRTLRLSINMNGIPAYKAATASGAIIKTATVSPSGIVALDNSGVSPQVLAICNAYDNLYERRRVEWVKIILKPRYQSFQANFINSALSSEVFGALYPPAVYTLSDNNGVNAGFDTIDLSQVMANTTGVRMKKMNRQIKVFRRALRAPLSPKYQQAAAVLNGDANALSNPAGAWFQTADTVPANSNSDHWLLVSEPVPSLDDTPLVAVYDAMFQIKLKWYDARTVSTT